MIIAMFIALAIAGSLFQKRLCELTSEEFHYFLTPDKTISSKLHVALFFGYIKYHDDELIKWGVVTQFIALAILIVFVKTQFF